MIVIYVLAIICAALVIIWILYGIACFVDWLQTLKFRVETVEIEIRVLKREIAKYEKKQEKRKKHKK